MNKSGKTLLLELKRRIKIKRKKNKQSNHNQTKNKKAFFFQFFNSVWATTSLIYFHIKKKKMHLYNKYDTEYWKS